MSAWETGDRGTKNHQVNQGGPRPSGWTVPAGGWVTHISAHHGSRDSHLPAAMRKKEEGGIQLPKENARSWYKETMTNSTANFSKPQASQASFPVPLEVPPPPHTHMQTHSSSVAVCTAPLFLLLQVLAAPAMQDDPPQEHWTHKQILEMSEFYPRHGVNMCADTVQAFKTDRFANPDFPFLLGDHLANHHSLHKTLFSLIKWDSW